MSKYFNVLPKNDDIKTSDIFNGWANIYSLIKKQTRNKSMIIAIDGDYSTNWDIYIQNLNSNIKIDFIQRYKDTMTLMRLILKNLIYLNLRNQKYQ